MEINDDELKMIERMRRQERSWPATRWVLLLTGVGGMLLWGYFFFLILGKMHDGKLTSDNLPVVVLLYPWCLIMLHISCGLAIIALANWCGHAKEMLLLKLLDSRPKTEDKSAVSVQN